MMAEIPRVSLDEVVSTLEKKPTEQCLVRRDFLVDHGIDFWEVAARAKRKFSTAEEIYESTLPNIGVRVVFYVFAPWEDT